MLKRDEIEKRTSCFNKACDAERLFVLLARDPAAPVAIRAWIAERIRLGKNAAGDEQIREAFESANLMELERPEVEEQRRMAGGTENARFSTSGMIRISRFASVVSAPECVTGSWQDLVAMLSTPRRTACTRTTCKGSKCQHKSGESWSPAMFRAGVRSKSSVEEIALLVFDVDNALEPSIALMREQLSQYQHLLHASHADQPGYRCLRAVIQLTRAVKPDEWRQFWLAAVQMLKAPVDMTCWDAARSYFLPSRPSYADYFMVAQEGKALDVDAVLASALPVHGSGVSSLMQEGAPL